MAQKVNQLRATERDALVQALIQKYEQDPAAVARALPEVAELLKVHLLHSGRQDVRPFFPLTLAEEKARQESLGKLLAKVNSGKGAVSKEEAVQALEDAAALIEASSSALLQIDRNNLVKLVRIATGLSFSRKGKPRKWVLREDEPARSVNLIRGVQLNLTRDKKLMSVEVDPKELRVWDKALKFIGIGHDPDPDAGRRHDEYAWGEPGHV